ncbi:hypothetical protein ACIGW0_23125 [Streptomyces bikiniensis]|uniref:Transposase n=1 Tax=Streptomyces bikiniensis TaxID=1896 RepID=A0ABW8CXE6_STRBI
MRGVVVAVAVALAAGCPLGRVRPWRRLGDWAVDEFRLAGPRVPGDRSRRTAVILAHLLTSPRASRQIARLGREDTPKDAGAYARKRGA